MRSLVALSLTACLSPSEDETAADEPASARQPTDRPGALLSPNPTQVLEGTGSRDSLFGIHMVGAGDLNGDRIPDVLIRAREGQGYGTGRVFGFAGGPQSVEPSARQAIDGAVARGRFGAAMAPAGDVDRDGHGDVWISAHGENLDEDDAREGRAYLFTGAIDEDGDGHPQDVDCNDADPSIRPGADDPLGNGVDQDCDGRDGPKDPPLDDIVRETDTGLDSR